MLPRRRRVQTHKDVVNEMIRLAFDHETPRASRIKLLHTLYEDRVLREDEEDLRGYR